MTCTFGLTPCPLTVLPVRTVMLSGRPKANITDFVPLVNISSFGMCSAPTNPTVISATAAAMGVFTPMPCVPAIVSPWIPGYPKVMVQGAPALTSDSRNVCMWLGQISFTNDGQIPLPPMPIVPPVGKPAMPTLPRLPLNSSDFSGGGGGGGGGVTEKQYKDDVNNAQKSGKQHDMMGDGLESESRRLAKAGNSGQAAAAAKKAEQARGTAADKRNEAVGDVNQRYRETMPLSKKQMEQMPPERQQEYQQQRADIMQQKEEEYRKADMEFNQKSDPTQQDAARRDLKKHFADKQEQESLKQLNLIALTTKPLSPQ